MERRRESKFLRGFGFYSLVLVSVILAGIAIFMQLSKPIEVKELDVSFIVGRGAGFDLNSTALVFGRVPPGGSGLRTMNFDNSHDFPVEIKILVSEDVVDYLDAQPSLIIEAGENASLPVSVSVPSEMEFGNYTGRIRFETYRFRDRTD